MPKRIVVRVRRLFGRKDKNELSSPDVDDAELSRDVRDLRQEDITDRVVVKHGDAFDETPELAVGSLVKVSRYKRGKDEVYETGELLLGGRKLVDFEKVVSRNSGRVLLRHVLDRKYSAEVGFLSFVTGGMEAQSLAEAEIIQAVTAHISPHTVDGDSFYRQIKDLPMPDHQYLAIVVEAAVITTSARIFTKLEGNVSAAYGFTIKGSAYALSEYIATRSFLAVTPRRHFRDNREVKPLDVTPSDLVTTGEHLALNNVSRADWIRAERLAGAANAVVLAP